MTCGKASSEKVKGEMTIGNALIWQDHAENPQYTDAYNLMACLDSTQCHMMRDAQTAAQVMGWQQHLQGEKEDYKPTANNHSKSYVRVHEARTSPTSAASTV